MYRGWMLPCLVIALIVGTSGRAYALGDGALEYIEPVIDRVEFERLLEAAGLDDDQRLLADLLYSDYAAALDELIRRTEERAEAAGRERVRQALSGRVLMDPEELRRTRVAVLRSYEQSWPRADQLFVRLVSDARGLIGDERLDQFDRALMDLRRAVWLRSRAASTTDETYAGDGVDLVLLVAQASAGDQELSTLDPGATSDVLATWERDMDALLRADAEAVRAARLERMVARIERDPRELEQAERIILEHWRQLDQLNRSTAQRIGAIAARRVGEPAQEAWRLRFDRACYPWLFRNTRPEKELRWIERHMPADVQQRARRIMDEFTERHVEICRQTIDLMRRGRVRHGEILHARMDPSSLDDSAAEDVYRELLKNSGRRSKLESDTSAALEALLTDRQRVQMASDIAAAAYGRRR